jgi:hypothetical protein
MAATRSGLREADTSGNGMLSIVGMVLMLRRFPATLSTVGLCASIWAYCDSFFGLSIGPATNAHPWIGIFFGGFIILYIPVVLMEYRSINERRFFWKGFAEARPRWAVPTIQTVGGIALAHFGLFLIVSHSASPEIVNGQFVLSDHGIIRRIISHAEYLSVVAWEMRFFASFWIFFYLMLTLYWWFPSARHEVNPYDAYS